MLSGRLLLAFFAITLGTSFQFGYHTAVMNAPLAFISGFINNVTETRYGYVDKSITETVASWCVSALLIGGLLGGLFGGFLSNRVGRKRGVFICSISNISGCICILFCKLAGSFELIIIGRLLIGLACGAYTAISPVYLSEIAPIAIRGAAGVLNQLMIVFGVVVAQVLGLTQIMNTEGLWPYLLTINGIACVVGLLCLLFCPESARYLYLVKNDRDAATRALAVLRPLNANIHEELDEYKNESENVFRKGLFLDLIRLPYLRKAIIVAAVAQIGQQFSGMNFVLYYSVEFLKSAKFTDDQATYANLGFGIFLFLFTVISVFLMDRIGRRPLFITGLMTCFFALIVATCCLIFTNFTKAFWPSYLALAAVFIFVAGFSVGPGSIPWFLVAEMFTQENRDSAILVAVFVNWTSNIIIGLSFLKLITYLEKYIFLPFVVIMFGVIVFMIFGMPETKGRTSTEIEDGFKARVSAPVVDSPSEVFTSETHLRLRSMHADNIMV